MKESEQDLLKKVKNSDKDAFHQLFSNFFDTLFRFVVYKVKDSDLAEDISQETFLRVWKKRASLVPQKSFFHLLRVYLQTYATTTLDTLQFVNVTKIKYPNTENLILMILKR